MGRNKCDRAIDQVGGLCPAGLLSLVDSPTWQWPWLSPPASVACFRPGSVFADFSDGCPTPWFPASKPEGHPKPWRLRGCLPQSWRKRKKNPQNFPNGRQLGQAGGVRRAWASLRDLIQGARSKLSPGPTRPPQLPL